MNGTEGDATGFHHAFQNGLQFEIQELFLSEVFHYVFLDGSWLWVTEPVGRETTDKGNYWTRLHCGESATLPAPGCPPQPCPSLSAGQLLPACFVTQPQGQLDGCRGWPPVSRDPTHCKAMKLCYSPLFSLIVYLWNYHSGLLPVDIKKMLCPLKWGQAIGIVMKRTCCAGEMDTKSPMVTQIRDETQGMMMRIGLFLYFCVFIAGKTLITFI